MSIPSQELCSHCKFQIFDTYKFKTNNSQLKVEQDELKRLGKRFKKLDLDGSGSLSIAEFMTIPELQQNPLVQRVISIFDADNNGEVDFKGKLIKDFVLKIFFI